MSDGGRVERLARPDGNVVAYARSDGRESGGKEPGVVFLGGFRSDMTGTKAVALESWAKREGRAFLRFDYLGHGQSSGRFEDGTIGRWLDDSLAAIDDLTAGKLVLVGSSMGGWLALLAARARPERIAGLVLIAAAPDFVVRMYEALSAEDRAALQRDGKLVRPSQYSPEPSVFTWKLLEEGRNHLVLDRNLVLPCPVRLLHGQDDPDVPWEHSLRIAAHIEAPSVVTTLIKGGDHRLSTPEDIARLIAAVSELTGMQQG
jgi:pimeloyl-ACP methyl ester carboxylesterase